MHHPSYFEKGWRISVGIVLINKEKKVFMGERIDNKGAWQMPQGGVNIAVKEKLDDAARRELFEETGVKNATIIDETEGWYYYNLPKKLKNKLWKGRFVGQKQKWFLFDFFGDDQEINLTRDKKPEFYNWKWVKPDDVCKKIVSFKKEIYEKILIEFNFLK